MIYDAAYAEYVDSLSLKTNLFRDHPLQFFVVQAISITKNNI
jgi:hypothetical protein